MAKQNAQNWLNGITVAKTVLKKIIETGATVANAATEVANANFGDELSGEIIVEGYPELEELFLDNNEITKLTVKNCPKLKVLNVGTNPMLAELNIDEIVPSGSNNLESLACGGTALQKVSFKNCKNLKNFDCPNTPSLDRIEKIDNLENIESLNMAGSGKVRIMHEVKHNYVITVVNEVKEMLGIAPGDNLPTTVVNGKPVIDTSSLKEQIKGAANKGEMDAIKVALGLSTGATQQQIIAKINELTGPGFISKVSLVSDAEDSLKGLGVDEGEISKLGAAASARDVEISRNKLVSGKFNELQTKLNHAYYLNIGLGTLSVGVLLILTWMILKDRKLLPGQEDEEVKE